MSEACAICWSSLDSKSQTILAFQISCVHFFNMFFYFLFLFLIVRKATVRIAKQYQGTQCSGALQTIRRRNGEKTRRYRKLQSASTKIHFPHLRCSQAKYLQIKFGGAKPDDLNDTLSFSTKEHLKALTTRPYAKWSLRPRAGLWARAQPRRDCSGATSAHARSTASGGAPCGTHTCGSWPRMQSTAADCAPVAKIAHHFRVYASAAERRSSG